MFKLTSPKMPLICSYWLIFFSIVILKKFVLSKKGGSSLIYNTSVRHERHECDTSNKRATLATRVRHEKHECYTSATRTTRIRHEWKKLILIATRVKTYFYTLIFPMWQVKDNKERNNFILRTTFWKCLVSMPKCV